MDGNPFQGTEFEQDWMDGLNAGLVAPNSGISAPSPLTVDAQDAFNQGVNAGQTLNAALEPPVPIEEGGLQSALEHVHEGVDVGGPLVHAWGATAGDGLNLVGRLRAVLVAAAPEILFSLVVLVAVWGPRRDGFFSDVVSARLEQVRQQIAETGRGSENLELFMAVCAESSHDFGVSDPLSELGVWHGPFRLSFDEAVGDGQEHEHPSAVRIHRYQTSQPTIVDVI
jgi:hypothetical protein